MTNAEDTLTVNVAGTYTFVSGSDTETLTLKINDVVTVDKNGEISIYDLTARASRSKLAPRTKLAANSI